MGRVSQLKFGAVVILLEDSLVKGTWRLMSFTGDGYTARQKIPSSGLAVFVERATDNIRPPSDDISIVR